MALTIKKFIAFIVILAAIPIVAIHSTYRFDVRLNKVSHKILSDGAKFGHVINLVPDVFNVGQSEEFVREKLEKAGFALVKPQNVRAKYADKATDGKYIYIREADTWFCKINLRVFVEYNNFNELVKAEGVQHENGCL